MAIADNLPTITTVGLTLNLDAEVPAIGDTIAFVEKTESAYIELTAYATALNTTVSGINAVATILNTVDIGTAYEIAVENGYVGTEVQWLASLQGIQGVPGPSGNGTGYVGPVYSTLDQTALDALVPGDYVIPSYGGVVELSDNAIRDFLGTVADTTERDAISNPQHGDYVIVTGDGGQYHYYDGLTDSWIDTGSTTLPVVPPDPSISPNSPSTSWNVVQQLPSVSTVDDLTGLDWNSYPDGVYVTSTGEVAYRADSANLVYQNLCGTSATAWASKGWVNNHAASGQAARMQAEVTVTTYCRMGFQIGIDVADSLMVEIQPTQIQAYDSDVAVGSPIAVTTGDIIGILRYENGQTRINVNKVDVYTFAASDTSAVNLYAYMLGIGDCIEYPMAGVDGDFLDPIVWTGYSDAIMTEVGRTESNTWSTTDPAITDAIGSASNMSGYWRVYTRAAGQSPVVGGPPNIYPDGATVGLVGVTNNDLFTVLIAPGESVIVDGNTISADDGYTNLEPAHFAKISSAIVRIGGN